MTFEKRKTLIINLDKIKKHGVFCGESLIEKSNMKFFDHLQKCFSLKIVFNNIDFREYDYILLLTIANFPELIKKGLKERTDPLFLETSVKQCLKCGYRTTHSTKKKCPRCKSTLYPAVLRKNEFLSEEKMRKIIEATTTVDEIIIVGGKPKLKVLKHLLEVIPEYFNIKTTLLDLSKLDLVVDVK